MIFPYFRSLPLKGREAIGSVDLARFLLVGMFTAVTTTSVKECTQKSVCHLHSIIRGVVVATVAIGMGLDFPDLDRIIHWEPSLDSEQYIQEPVELKEMA